jgi:hypothetical protein
MIDNFKLSSSVLLERLKDLEAQNSMIGERPQTANVLSKIGKLTLCVNFQLYSGWVSGKKNRSSTLAKIIEGIFKVQKDFSKITTWRL